MNSVNKQVRLHVWKVRHQVGHQVDNHDQRDVWKHLVVVVDNLVYHEVYHEVRKQTR